MIVKEMHSDEQVTPTDRPHATSHLHLNIPPPPPEISSLEGPRPVLLHCHIDPLGDVCWFFSIFPIVSYICSQVIILHVFIYPHFTPFFVFPPFSPILPILSGSVVSR